MCNVKMRSFLFLKRDINFRLILCGNRCCDLLYGTSFKEPAKDKLMTLQLIVGTLFIDLSLYAIKYIHGNSQRSMSLRLPIHVWTAVEWPRPLTTAVDMSEQL